MAKNPTFADQKMCRHIGEAHESERKRTGKSSAKIFMKIALPGRNSIRRVITNLCTATESRPLLVLVGSPSTQRACKAYVGANRGPSDGVSRSPRAARVVTAGCRGARRRECDRWTTRRDADSGTWNSFDGLCAINAGSGMWSSFEDLCATNGVGVMSSKVVSGKSASIRDESMRQHREVRGQRR